MSRWSQQQPIEKWDYNELVDYIEAYLLKSLLKGDFHDAVFSMLQLAIQWHKGHKERKV